MATASWWMSAYVPVEKAENTKANAFQGCDKYILLHESELESEWNMVT